MVAGSYRAHLLPKPYTSPQDVFCLREKRMVKGYRRISLSNHEIQVANVPLYEDADVHLVPDIDRQLMRIRIWWHDRMVHSVALPLDRFRVHF